jgi:hypothetical protein
VSLARTQREFLDRVVGPAEPGEPRMAVYHRTSLAARCGALAAAYPVVRRLVGVAFFEEAAATHARTAPSTSGDLHAYGAAFATFLATYLPARSLPCLADVARLEWAVHESSHADDGVPFDFAALGRVAPDSLGAVRIALHPAVRLVASVHPILAIWEANQPDRDGTLERDDGADRVVVRRVGYAVVPVATDLATWTLLQAFERGASLEEARAALEAAGESFEEALARLAGLGVLGRFAIASAA